MPSPARHRRPSSSPSATLLHATVALARGAMEQALADAAPRQPPREAGAPGEQTPAAWSVALTAPLGAVVMCESVGRSLTAVVDLPATMGALPPAVELAARVIVTEAIANVARHAWASECTVRLRPVRGLRLEVVDDGVGLPPLYRARAGLRRVAEQVEQLGGRWQIGTEVGGGTRLAVWLPFPVRAD